MLHVVCQKAKSINRSAKWVKIVLLSLLDQWKLLCWRDYEDDASPGEDT